MNYRVGDKVIVIENERDGSIDEFYSVGEIGTVMYEDDDTCDVFFSEQKQTAFENKQWWVLKDSLKPLKRRG